MKEYLKHKYSLHIFIIIILLAMSFFTVVPVLNMILLGAMVAYGLTPVAKRIQSKVKYESISIFIAIILVVIPLILLFGYIFWEISVFADLFFNSTNIIGPSSLSINELFNSAVSTLPVEIQGVIKPYLPTLSGGLQSIFSYLLKFIVSLVKSFSDILIQLFVLICSIYYFTRDGDEIWENIFVFIPEKHKDFFGNTINEVANVLKSIFYGHFLTAVIIGIMGGVGYYFLGYPFALFIGIITGIFQLFPILGPWIVYWTLAAYAIFVTGDIVQAILTILWGFVLSLSDMYIRPALASNYADIPSLILLVGFMAGPYVFGIVGFILGPLILGVTYAVIKSLKEELEKDKNKNDESDEDSVEDSVEDDVKNNGSDEDSVEDDAKNDDSNADVPEDAGAALDKAKDENENIADDSQNESLIEKSEIK